MINKLRLSHSRKIDLLILTIIIFSSIFFIVRWHIPFHYPSSDGGMYLTLAKSFAEGKGYRSICLPEEPIHSHYPFGWPLLLSLVYKNPFMTHLLTSLFFLFTALIIYIFARCYFGYIPSFLISFAFISNFQLCEFIHSAFSDIPFSFFLYGSFLLFTLAIRSENKKLYLFLIITIVFSTFIRFIGEVLILSLALTFILNKKWKYLYFLAIVLCIKFMLHFAFQHTAWITKGYFLSDFLLNRNIFGAVAQNGMPAENIKVIGYLANFFNLLILNLKRMLLTYIPWNLFPSLYHLYPMDKFKIIICLFISLSVFGGVIISIIHRNYLIPFSLILMLFAMSIGLGSPQTLYRFYAPLTSLFLMLFLLTLKQGYYRISLINKKLYIARICTVIFAILFLSDRILYNNKILHSSFFRSYPEATTDFQDFCGCIHSTFSDKSILSAPAPGMVHIHSQRKVAPFPHSPKDPSIWGKILKRKEISQIVIPGWWYPMAHFQIKHLEAELAAENPDGYYKIQYGTSYPTYAYYQSSNDYKTELSSKLLACLEQPKLNLYFIKGKETVNVRKKQEIINSNVIE